MERILTARKERVVGHDALVADTIVFANEPLEVGNSPSQTVWCRGLWTKAESLAIFRKLGKAYGIAGALNTLAEVAIMDEDPAEAEMLLAESGVLGQLAASDTDVVIWRLNHLGHAAQVRGDYARAAQLHHESLTHMPSHCHAGLLAAYHGLGEVALGLNNLDEARDWLAQGLLLSRKVNDQPFMAWCLASLGSLVVWEKEPERATRLWSAAERLRQELGVRTAPAARATYERAMAMAQAQLSEDAFTAAWADGQAMLIEQALVEALGDGS